MKSVARVTRPPKSEVSETLLANRQVYRFSVQQYHQIIDTGMLAGQNCELLHGVILEKPVANPPHASTTRKLTRFFFEFFPDPEWVVGVQATITLKDSEPEPDLFVAHGPEEEYASRHPEPSDLVLVIEVADTSLEVDRTLKLSLYSSSKISQYWIVDINARTIEVYTQPRGGKNPGYRHRVEYGPEDAVPVVVAGKKLGSIPVKDLLP